MPPALSVVVSPFPRVPCVRLWARACVQTRVRVWEEPHTHPGPAVAAETDRQRPVFLLLLLSREGGESPITSFRSEGRPAAKSHLLTDTPLITTPAQVNSMQGRPGSDFPSERQLSCFKEARDPEYGTLCSRPSK